MKNLDQIIKIAEWLALPVTYIILTLLFFIFVVRPFFAYLFNYERFKHAKEAKSVKKKTKEYERILDEVFDDGDDTVALGPQSEEKGLSDTEKMGKLAESDPDKAGDLVKQWLRKE